MLVHLTRSAFPSRLDDFRLQIESDGMSNFEMLLEGESFDGWTLPASTMAGHPVWFQVTKGSHASALKVLREAERAGDSHAMDLVAALLPELEEWSGCLVAVGLAHGGPERSIPVDSHFRGRIFAPVSQVTPLSSPVPTTAGSALSELAPFARTAAQLTNRVVGGDDEYERMLNIVEEAVNEIPDWARVKINAVKGTWSEVANDRASAWIYESQLADQFAVPLCRELSDGRRVEREVNIRPTAESKAVRWSVDGLIEIGGVPLPVEFKLNRNAEADLPAQLRRYSGPSTLKKATAKRERRWTIDHPYVLLIDNEGISLFRSGELVADKNTAISRGEFTQEKVAKLRATTASLISAS